MVSVNHLSTSAQNYLKAIWALQEWSSDPVAPSALAAHVGVRPPTVTDAVKKLAAEGLVENVRYGAIELTPAGRQAALEMVRRHRLIETYLVNELGYSWDEVHEEAEHLEHACSDLMIARICDKLGNPSRDPHGDPIPAADGTIEMPDAVPLHTVAPDSTVIVERIADSNPELLVHLAELGITIGEQLCLTPGPPFSDSLLARTAAGEELTLGSGVIRSIWVSLVS